MLSDIFENAKDLLADIYLENAEEKYLCTIANKEEAVRFEKRKNKPRNFKVIFREKNGGILCFQHFRKQKMSNY